MPMNTVIHPQLMMFLNQNQKKNMTITTSTMSNSVFSSFLISIRKRRFLHESAKNCSINEWLGRTSTLVWWREIFSHPPYFKFVIHNMIMRKRAIENSNFVVHQKLGDFRAKKNNSKWWRFIWQFFILFWSLTSRKFTILGTKGKRTSRSYSVSN